MRNVCRVLLLLCFSTTLWADGGFNFPNHKKGFWITPKDNPNSLVPLASGDKKTFELDLCVVKWGEENKKERCQKVPDTKLEFHAYFPDKLHDVTSQIQVTKSKDKKSWKVIYQTEELKASDLNQFSFIIGSVKSSAESLLKTQAKFEKRILELAKLRAKFIDRQNKEKYIAYIDKMIALLTDVNHRIDLALESSPDVLAEISLPLQVDNNLAAPFYYASNFSGQKMAMKLTHGSAIEGESVVLDATVTNLSHLDFKFPSIEKEEREEGEEKEHDGQNNYNYSISFNGQKIVQKNMMELAFGESWSESKILSKLNPNDTNDISFILSKIHREDDADKNDNKKDKKKDKKKEKDEDEKRWGSLYSTIPVAPDAVTPVFTEVQPDSSIEYAQSFPSIRATLSDSFGRINPDSIALKGSAILVDDTNTARDFSSVLIKNKIQDGQSYLLSSEVNPLEEGLWTLTLRGADYAGNYADDVVRNIRIDRTAPIINLSSQDNILTNQNIYSLNAIISDLSPVSLQIFQNGQLVYSTELVQVSYDATLQEGVNSFLIKATDAAGNITQKNLSSIILDTIPPALSITTPPEDLITNDKSLIISGSANEMLSSISLNSNSLNLAPDKLKFDGTFELSNYGQYELSFSATDLAGNSSSIIKKVTRNSPPIANLTLPVKVEEKRLFAFNAQLSSDSDGSIIEYKIETGDGEILSSSSPLIEYVYKNSGTYTGKLFVTDNNGASASKSFIVNVLANNPPFASFTTNPSIGKAPLLVTLNASASSDPDGDSLTYSWEFSDGTMASGVSLQHSFTNIGNQYAKLTVIDERGLQSSSQVDITVENPNLSPIASMNCNLSDATLNCVSTSSDQDGTIVSSKWLVDGKEFTASSIHYEFPGSGSYTIVLVVQDNAGAESTATQSFTVVKANAIALLEEFENKIIIPPDPSSISTPIDGIKWSNIFDQVNFLFAGSNPIQQMVIPETIDKARTCIIKGKFVDSLGNPIKGVKVEITDRSEFGYTISRADGEFDYVVNGAERYNLYYSIPSYVGNYQSVECPYNDFLVLDKIVLSKRNPIAKIVNFASSNSTMIEESTSKIKIYIPSNTPAKIVKADGSEIPVSNANLRISARDTSNDPVVREGELLADVEITLDEEILNNGREVKFDQAIPLYLPYSSSESVGTIVDVHYFNRQTNQDQVLESNGLIISKIGSNNGRAMLDTNGDGSAEDLAFLNALGISSEELIRIDSSFNNGEKFIRASTYHLTSFKFYIGDSEIPFYIVVNLNSNIAPTLSSLSTLSATYGVTCSSRGTFQDGNKEIFYCNYGSSPKFVRPSPPTPPIIGRWLFEENFALINSPIVNADYRCGSIIDVQNQTLGESIPIVGTDFNLSYKSDRVDGMLAKNQIRIPLSAGELPNNLEKILLRVDIAGRRFDYDFSPLSDPEYIFTWDGLDGYGRKLFGAQKATIKLGYSFTNTQPKIAWSGSKVIDISKNFLNDNKKLGGWSLDVHHNYDPISKTLYKGNGTEINSSPTQFNKYIEYKPHKFNFVSPYSNLVNWKSIPFPNDDRPAIKLSDIYFDGFVSNPLFMSNGNTYYLFYIYNENFSRALLKIDKNENVTFLVLTLSFAYKLKLHNGIDESYITAHGAHILDYINFIRLGNHQEIFIINDSAIYKYQNNIITTIFPNSKRGLPLARTNSGVELKLKKILELKVGPNDDFYAYVQYDWPGLPDYPVLYKYPSNGDENQRVAITNDNWTQQTQRAFSFNDIDGKKLSNFLDFRFIDYIISKNNEVFMITGFNLDAFLYPQEHRIIKVDQSGIVSNVIGGGTDKYEGITSSEFKLSLAAFKPLYSLLGNFDFNNSSDLMAFDKNDNLVFFDDSSSLKESYLKHLSPSGNITSVATTPQSKLQGTLEKNLFGDIQIYSPQDLSLKVFNQLPSILVGSDEFMIPSTNGQEGYVFNFKQQHIRTINPMTGELIRKFIYSNAGLVTGIEDKFGNKTSFLENGSGEIGNIISPFGHTTSLVYDGKYLSQIINPENATTSLTYTGNGLLSIYTLPNGNSTFFTYDQLGRLLRDTNSAGGYQDFQRQATPNGVNVQVSDEKSSQSIYETIYQLSGEKRMKNVDKFGHTTETIYYPNDVENKSYSNGLTVSKKLKRSKLFGSLVPLVELQSIKTPGGLENRYAEDLSITLPSNNADPFTFLTLISTSYINEKTYKTTYDKVAKKITNRSPAGRETYSYLDSMKNITSSQVSGLLPLEYERNIKGQMTSILQGERSSTMTYDSSGNISSLSQGGQTTLYEYDLVGRVTKQIQPDGGEIFYSYDLNGNLTSVVPAGRPAHQFVYNSLDFISDYIPPEILGLAATTQYSYTPSKKLLQVNRPDSKTILYNYHPQTDRLQGWVSSDDEVNLTYNSSTGQLSSIIKDNFNSLSYSYDGPLVTSITQAGDMTSLLSFAYNNDFRPISLSLNNNLSINYSYDNDGLLTGAASETLTHSPVNGLLSSTQVGVVREDYSYTNYGEVSSYTVKVGSTPIFTQNYTRDLYGRIMSLDNNSETMTFSYDSVGQLSSVSNNSNTVASLVYDQNGNRLDYNGILGTYDNQDRLITYGDYSFTYNGNGDTQTISDSTGTTTLDYDVYGNLLTVSLPSKNISYAIDPLNRRIGKKVNGSLTQGFVYQDQLNPIAELDGSGNVISIFVYASKSNVPDYMVKNGVNYKIISDHLGSPRLVVNANDGTIVQEMSYSEFGEVVTDTNPGFQPFGFAGGLYDLDTGLVRFGARDYNPVTGRWMQKDPSGFNGGDTNLYRYVHNDPINFFDPTGNFEVPSWAIDAGAGAASSLTFGLSDYAIDAAGYGSSVNRNSTAYNAGYIAGTAVSVARLGYAVTAKVASRLASSGAAASAARTAFKNRFGLGLTKNIRKPNLAGLTDAQLRASAGRTNPFVNAWAIGNLTTAGGNATDPFFSGGVCGGD